MISLPFSLILRSLYADKRDIWASSPSVEHATSTVQAALNRLVKNSPNGVYLSTSFFSLDPYQSRLKSTLSFLLNILLNFDTKPTFFGATFERTLSFKHHVLSLRKKFLSRFRAFRSIASAFWSVSKKFLCTLYKAFIPLILTYAFPCWFPFSPPTHITTVDGMPRFLIE